MLSISAVQRWASSSKEQDRSWLNKLLQTTSLRSTTQKQWTKLCMRAIHSHWNYAFSNSKTYWKDLRPNTGTQAIAKCPHSCVKHFQLPGMQTQTPQWCSCPKCWAASSTWASNRMNSSLLKSQMKSWAKLFWHRSDNRILMIRSKDCSSRTSDKTSWPIKKRKKWRFRSNKAKGS